MISKSNRYLLVSIVSVGIALVGIGIGIGIGYAIFNNTKITGCEQGVPPSDGTTPKSTTSISTTQATLSKFFCF
jgi:hypothetical protein